MRDWLTIELVLTTLLVTSFTSVGLLALWAATSPRHWFVRTAVVLAALSPLLIIPAYEPFLTFILQTFIVASGVAVYRIRRSSDRFPSSANNEPGGGVRFSLLSTLLISTLIAITFAIVAALPASIWTRWLTISAISAAAAITTLLAAWVAFGASLQRVRCAVCIAYAMIVTLAFVLIAQMSPSQSPFSAGQPIMGLDVLAGYFSIYEHGLKVVFAVAIAYFLCLVLVLGLVKQACQRATRGAISGVQLIFARSALCLYSILLLTPPLLVGAMLLRPVHIPDHSPLPADSLDKLVAIGDRFKRSTIQKEIAQDIVNNDKLDAAVSNYDADYAELRRVLKTPFRIPMRYEYSDLDVEEVQALRTCARVLSGKAAAALRAGDVDESLACSLDILRLAESAQRDGLLIHFMVASAIEGIATSNLYKALKFTQAQRCRPVIDQLADYDSARTDIAALIERDRIWTCITYGWPARLGLMLQEFADDGITPSLYRRTKFYHYPKDQAVLRLLKTEFALRAYKLENNRPPSNLEELVPTILTSVPVDPFGSHGKAFVYEAIDDGFTLSSRGPKNFHGNDDSSYIGMLLVNVQIGDLRLDVHFAADDDTSPADTANASSE